MNVKSTNLGFCAFYGNRIFGIMVPLGIDNNGLSMKTSPIGAEFKMIWNSTIKFDNKF